MTTPIIKKSQMKPAEWTSLVDVLRRVDVRKAAAIVQDNKVTDKEMNKLLDRNSDGKVTYQDFSSIQNILFSQVKDKLQKYKFRASRLWGPLHIYQFVNYTRIPKQFWSDRDFVLAAVKQDGDALKYAAASLKKDKGIVLAAVKRGTLSGFSLAFWYADASLRRDKEFVLAAVKEDGSALEYAHKKLKRNRKIVLTAIEQDGTALRYAAASLRRDKKIVLTAVKQNGWALQYAAASLRRDKKILLAAVKQSYMVYKDIFLEEKLWKLLQGDAELNKFFTKKELKNQKSFCAALKTKHNIRFLRRFNSLSALIEMLKNRQTANAPNDNRPLCIIIYPKTDGNGAFEIDSNIGQMIKLGYRVIYHEAGDEKEVAKYLKSATANGKYPAKTIILGGHGTSTSLALGGEDGGWDTYNEHLYIDTGDFKGKDELQLARYLQPGGDLLLNSCSNGAGGASNQANLANTIARTLYSGILVHSYTMLSFGSSIRVVGGGLKVKLNGDSGYRVWGSKPRPPATAPLPAVKVQCEMLPEWDII